jgi:hypothetical protein
VLNHSGGVFAFDCEWTPVLSFFEPQYLAILTIVTRDRGFLIDCLALRPIQDDKPTENDSSSSDGSGGGGGRGGSSSNVNSNRNHGGVGGGETVAQTLHRMFSNRNLTNIGASRCLRACARVAALRDADE